jgi:hypothetical protein
VELEKKNKLLRYNALTSDIEGWFTNLAVVTSQSLFAFQDSIGIKEDYLEIGAWHGLSAGLWFANASQGEKIWVVDLDPHDELVKNLERFGAKCSVPYELIIGSSATRLCPEFVNEHWRALRLIHIDGDHSEAGIAIDLEITRPMLSQRGILIVDDFMNIRFPQITNVVFDFLHRYRHEFSLLVCGGNKAFIVKAKFYDAWYDYCDNNLAPALNDLSSTIYSECTVDGRRCFGIR